MVNPEESDLRILRCGCVVQVRTKTAERPVVVRRCSQHPPTRNPR